MAPSRDLGDGLTAVVHPHEGVGKAMERPHVHVYNADGVVKIDLETFEELERHDMKPRHARKAKELVEAKQRDLKEMWDASRPTE